MSNQLLPCPFCGQTEYLQFHDGHPIDHERLDYIHCTYCLVKGPGATNRHCAELKWNERVKE